MAKHVKNMIAIISKEKLLLYGKPKATAKSVAQSTAKEEERHEKPEKTKNVRKQLREEKPTEAIAVDEPDNSDEGFQKVSEADSPEGPRSECGRGVGPRDGGR